MQEAIELVHLQLTRKCNLRCRFCGQWGEHGFAKSDATSELSPAEWLDVIDDIRDLNSKKKVKAKYILWGGEPLLNPAFPDIVKRLHDDDCRVAVVTNGTLLKENSKTINQYIDTLYVSLDGPKEIHEYIRGQSDIYEKIQEGIVCIDKDKVKAVGMFTVCEDNCDIVADYPNEAATMGFSEIIFQNLIYCSSSIAEEFRNWMHTCFNQKASTVDSWICDDFGEWIDKLPLVIQTLKNNAVNDKYPISVKLYPDSWMNENVIDWFDPDKDIPKADRCCELPWKHLHIRANGNVDFCVDHNDFVLGNVSEKSIKNMLASSTAQAFREEVKKSNNPLCKRCPWHYNKNISGD